MVLFYKLCLETNNKKQTNQQTNFPEVKNIFYGIREQLQIKWVLFLNIDISLDRATSIAANTV